ncbi:MAG: lipase maturation factor family protein [Chthoniobacterales bacterium]|nr:lipase maturation factor family protein [Chthoniobacterales bacterium]
MTAAIPRRVANPPAKPLLIFDGDCHFCRRWIERWREMTGDAVEYAPSQERAAAFPEIAPEEFAGAVQLIEPDGRIVSGAEAVFRSLAHRRGGGFAARCYERLPGFAFLTEAAYSIVARNRTLASAATRLLWGHDVRRPNYFVSRRWFLRALGAIFLIAFSSLWVQVDGLVGANGILPVAGFLPAARAHLGASAPFLLPTLCWLNTSDMFLHLLCATGAAASLLLMVGIAPALSLLLAFVCYLSLTIAGQTFLSFQWDILLLETGFLAIFFAPWTWRMTARNEAPLSRVALFLLKLLLFKLMFMSGVVKLTSGDDSWWDLTALNYHFETQPLPTVLGWWAHQAPLWLQQFSTVFVLVVETIVPFLIWAPRRPRVIGCMLLIALQVLILLTGNYAFFNLLTIALCLLLVDDTAWRSLRGRSGHAVGRDSVEPGSDTASTPGSTESGSTRLGAKAARWLAVVVLLLTLPVNAALLFSAFQPEASWPRPVTVLHGMLEPFRIVNGYGLFRVMTKSRPEIVVEGSADGTEWLPYEFRWKPGDLHRAPRWVAPHQPRLDWQMWFAALGTYRDNRWFLRFAESLLRNSPDVVALLERNPFPETPPRYVRARVYDYSFTRRGEGAEPGAWWKRGAAAEYLPAVSLGRE